MAKSTPKPLPPTFNFSPLTRWDQRKAAENIKLMFESTVNYANENIEWYKRSKKWAGDLAKFIKFVAILLLMSSTLMPYLASMNEDAERNINLLYIGYLLAGVGGGFMMLDRFFGFSTSWIRSTLTGMDLETMRNTFIEHWQIVYLENVPLTKARYFNLVKEIVLFRDAVDKAVRTETETWAREFEQSMRELSKSLNTQNSELKEKLDSSRREARDAKEEETEEDDRIPEFVFQEAIKKHFKEWKDTYNIIGVAYGKKLSGGDRVRRDSLVFIPARKLEKDTAVFTEVPDFIPFTASDGEEYDLPTDVRPAGGAMRASADGPKLLCDSESPKRPGCSISRINDNDLNRTGTIGMVVYKRKRAHILSCYHVLCALELERGQRSFSEGNMVVPIDIVSPSRQDSKDGQVPIVLGKVTDGELDNKLDGAIMEINGKVFIDRMVCSINRRPGPPLEVLEEHADQNLSVVSVGRTSGVIRGAIEFHDSDCFVEYKINGEWQEVHLENIILSNQGAQGGDSGALVMDNENNVIGIIAASAGELTCIIPIERLLTRFNVTLNPSK